MMNRRQRLSFRAATQIIVDKIVREKDTREKRFGAIAGTYQAIHKLAADRGLDPREAVEEFGGEVARQVVARLGAPPIGELCQALCYMGSRDPAHRAASRDCEMAALALKHPEAFGGGSRRRPLRSTCSPSRKLRKTDDGAAYLLTLRQTILLTTKTGTPPARAARRLIDRVYRDFKIGRLRLTETAAPLGDTSNVEIFARWLMGELTAADAATEAPVLSGRRQRAASGPGEPAIPEGGAPGDDRGSERRPSGRAALAACTPTDIGL
jgi:hypothetical protein